VKTERISTETLAYERVGHVSRLVLNRPEKLNAMTATMWRELAELGARLRDDPSVRALVVMGSGRAFSAGIDLAAFGDGSGSGGLTGQAQDTRDTAATAAAIARTQEAYLWLVEAPYPTIAAVRGFALGAGMQLALACDLRLAASGTRFGMLETRYGLMPDLCGTQLLPRVVGPTKAKELIFTAAQIDADEALRIGLVNKVVTDDELDAAASALADQLAAQPPIAMRWSKRAVDAALCTPLRDGLRQEHQGQAECIGSADFKEAIAAFVAKRPPSYTGS